MKNKYLLIAVLSSLVMTGCSSGGANRVYTQKFDVTGVITSSSKAPEICAKESSNGSGGFLGAVIGGVIGNQFGSGNGRIAMTVLGAGAGAAIGSSGSDSKFYKCKSDGYINQVFFQNPVTNKYEYKIIKTERRKDLNTKVTFKYKHTYQQNQI